MRATRVTSRPDPRPKPVPAAAHNRVLRAAERRAAELEDRLVEIITPILERAGEVAARNFEARAARVSVASIRQTFSILASAPTGASTMVALKPTPAQAAMLAEDGGDPPEHLHVTLAYLGETEGDLSAVADALAGVPGAHAPLEGAVGGVGHFAEGESGSPAILLPSVPGLIELRHHVTDALARAGIDYSRGYGFQPHMTTRYVEEPRTPPPDRIGAPLNFDDLWVVRGDAETIQLPLTGVAPVTASASDQDVLDAIADVAGRYQPDGGYGDAWWHAADATVMWISADWTSSEDAEAAVEELLAIPGVEWVDDCAECPSPKGPGWELAYPRASLEAASPPGEPPFCLPSALRTKTDPVRQAVVETIMRTTVEGAGLGFDFTNPLAGKVLAQSGSQIQGIAETTQLDVMKTVRYAYEQGLTIPDTAKAIRAAMAEAAPWRARMIARTELAGAVNGASVAATRIVEDATGASYRKVWLTAPGAHYPRHEDYPDLDQQTRALDEPFDVGGYDLMHPGDPSGPAHEVINCRCALAYTDRGDLEAGGGLSWASQAPPRDDAPSGAKPGRDMPVADREAVRAELAAVAAAFAGGPADWVPPAPEELLSVQCEGHLAPTAPPAWTPPPAQTPDAISVGAGPRLSAATIEKIQQLGLDEWPPRKGPEALRVFGDAKDTETLYRDAGSGEWDAGRAVLHQRIIDRHFEGKVAGDGPLHAYFTAGGGASGKSDLRFELDGRQVGSDELGERPDTVLVDPDRIKQMLPEFEDLVDVGDPYAASGVHEESSYIAKQVVAEARARGLNVVLDTTGSTDGFLGKIEAMRRQGYDTQVSMMSVPTNEAIKRAMVRGEKPGGRYVAITPLKNAHRGASQQLARWMDDPVVGRWKVYDNGGPNAELVAEGGGGHPARVYDQEKLDEILAKGAEPAPAPAPAPAAETVDAETLGRIDDAGELPPLDSLPLPADGYLAGLQGEMRRLGKQIAAARFSLKAEVDQERRLALEARMAAWEKRRAELRALIDDPDPKGELRRLTKQIASARFEINHGRGSERLRARLDALERRREQVRKILGSSVRDIVDRQDATRGAEEAAATAAQATASSDERIKVAGELVDAPSYLTGQPSWAREKVLEDGPGGYFRLPPQPYGRGSAGEYEMGESIVFTDARGSGIVVRVEMERGGDPVVAANAAQRQLSEALGATPDWMQGRLDQVVLASGENPDDLYWQGAYKNFTTSGATAGNGTITFWTGNRPHVHSLFDHELGHIVGMNGGPRAPGSWRIAQREDEAAGLKRIDSAAAKYGSITRGGGHNFIIGGDAVSDYGANSMSEDWAESIRLYLLDQRDGAIGTYRKADGFLAPARFADIYPSRAKLIERWLRGSS